MASGKQTLVKVLQNKEVRKLLLGRGKGAGIVVVLFIVLLAFLLPAPDRTPPSPEEAVYDVVRCVDGDTIVLDDGYGNDMKIRFIGSDTPETVKPNTPKQPFGDEASAFTKRIIADAGNKVRLAYDGDKTDRFGRTLALVYVETPEGEIMLNERLIREGLARAKLNYHYSAATKERFRAAEEVAKAERRNIWSLPESFETPAKAENHHR